MEQGPHLLGTDQYAQSRRQDLSQPPSQRLIHAGHGYLIAEFLSPYANKRIDRYGGNFDNRVRFLQEIYQEVHRQVGVDFPVTIRFSADEGFIGGRDISEAGVLAQLCEEWGFDALHVSVGVYGDHNKFGTVSPLYVGHAGTCRTL